MRSKLKTVSLENRFPLLSVEENMIVSKGGDLTVAFRMELPEIFTVTPSEYVTLHTA